MALAVRIIPVLLANGSRLVKGRQFVHDRIVGHVMQEARKSEARGVDEMIVLDVSGRGSPQFPAIKALTDECFMPLTVGGGVRSIADINGLLNAGADKVSLCTAAIQNPQMIYQASQRFGSQAITVAIDFDSVGRIRGAGSVVMARADGVVGWAKEVEMLGAGEILLTSIEREGTMSGYDLDMIRSVCDNVSIPVIAHGGCKDYADMANAVKAGASAVAAGALFAFTDATPKGAAEYLSNAGVTVRL